MNTACTPVRCERRRRGAAIVEFAIVAPLFFMLILGIIEFGRMVMVQQILTNAAREGARVGVLSNATTSQVDSAVSTYLSAVSISGQSISVTPDPPSSASPGSLVTVTVTVPFANVCWMTPFFLRSTILKAKCVMRTEQT